jgi:hypothetical protein
MPLSKQTTFHPLYGRRVLHVLSPVRWSGQKFIHSADSNYRVVEKTISWLPFCHHYVLLPASNDIVGDSMEWGEDMTVDNITYIKHPYPASVLYNRSFFDSKSFLKYVQIHLREIDIDFVLIHQPELLYNVEAALQVARIGPCLKKFSFFHWIDSPASKPIEDYPEGYFRHLEAITLSDKVFFHCGASKEYLASNWKKPQITQGLNNEYLDKKVTYMPLSSVMRWDETEETPIPLPNGKRILVFNHRWNNSTGISKLIKFTEKLDRDKYLVWVTDKDAKRPKSGDPAPTWMHVENLTTDKYKYLIKHAYATLTFLDEYATWNMSVQDGLELGTPGLVMNHPVMDWILGTGYLWYFSNQGEFDAKLNSLSTIPSLVWKLPNHDERFKKNLFEAMIENIHVMKQEPKGSREWVKHILELGDSAYKRHLLFNTHPKLHAGNSWERLRSWCMNNGAVDDPKSKYTRLWFPKEDEARKLIDGLDLPETLKDPEFTTQKSRFW